MEISNFPKITTVLRGYKYEEVRLIAKVLADSEFASMEVTLNTPDALEIISKISREFSESVNIGAGTVLSIYEANKAIEAGAKFLLSPIMLTEDIIKLCKRKNVVSVPAAFSPTEIKTLFDYGADIVKVFPADALGPKFFADVQAPLGPLPLMAVCGITADNVKEYFKAGASFAGIGSGVFKKEDIISLNEEGLRNSIIELREKLK